MQTPAPAAVPVEIRPPWPDEMARVRHFLPGAFLFDPHPEIFVAVRGAEERIVAAALLAALHLEDGTEVIRLFLRVDAAEGEHARLGAALTRRALTAAWERGAVHLFLAHTVAENSEPAAFWLGLGFQPRSVLESYEVVSRESWARMDRAYRLVRSRGLVPAGVEVLTILPRLVGPVQAFLREHMPGTALMLAAENSSCKPEHSLALLVHGEVKGVLLARREGRQITFGLRLVAPELRGGIGWANLLLVHRSLSSGLQSGQETTRFELDPETHADTRQLALAIHARLLARRLCLGMDRENLVDTPAAVS